MAIGAAGPHLVVRNSREPTLVEAEETDLLQEWMRWEVHKGSCWTAPWGYSGGTIGVHPGFALWRAQEELRCNAAMPGLGM